MDTFAVMLAVAEQVDAISASAQRNAVAESRRALARGKALMLNYARDCMVQDEPHPIRRAIIRQAAARVLVGAPGSPVPGDLPRGRRPAPAGRGKPKARAAGKK